MFIFLGAGASSPFGVPTMPEFAKLFDQELNNTLCDEVKKTFGDENFDLEVLMTVLEDLSKSGQEFFRTVSPQTADFLFRRDRERALSYVNDAVVKDEARKLLVKIKSIIRRECIKAIKEKEPRIIEVYETFFELLDRARLALEKKGTSPWQAFSLRNTKIVFPLNLRVFTTNYDTCIETYLNRRQLDFTRGIVPKYGYYVFDVSSYGDGRADSNRIEIFKLHGSIDLFQKGDQIRQLQALGADITYLGEEYGEESMRWPIEFGGYRHIIESPYLDLFRLLRDRVKDDSWWIIIGSSFRDRTICSILNDVLRLKAKRDLPRILLLDKEPTSIVQRLGDWGYHSLADIIHPVNVEFGHKEFSDKVYSAFTE